MRYSESKIKAAILHPEGEVRLTAVRYFADSHTADTSIMPLVTEAIDRFNHRSNEELLWLAQHLPQTPATIDWIMAKLRKPFDTDDPEQDNLRYSFAEVLLRADADILARRHNDILALPSFPAPMKHLLGEIVKLDFMDWPNLWADFEKTSRAGMLRGQPTIAENRRLSWIMRAATRHQSYAAEAVLSLLQGNYQGYDESLMMWMEPKLVELAGRLRLKEAIPCLIERIDDDNEEIDSHLGTALSRIGGDEVIKAVADKWFEADTESRFTLAEPLGHIHTPLAVQRILSLLEQEDEFDLRVALAFEATSQFATECIEPVRKVLLAKEMERTGDGFDLSCQLIATATIMGETFREYPQWHKELVASDYGYEDIKDKIAPHRKSDSYVEEGLRERELRRIVPKTKATFQLKISLQRISPPIWRRVLVPDCMIDDLHEIIQIVMGWESYHLYSFKIGRKEFTHPEMDEGELNLDDATSNYLSNWLKKPKQSCTYRYDFGDGWEHKIVVEKLGKAGPKTQQPVCLAGIRSCPPEDVGGPFGYAEYLHALADPDHERHEEMIRWRGKFDAEAFDLDAVNKALRKVFR